MVDIDNDFLKLVNEHYNDANLVEWEPAPPAVSKPHEPGNLGGTIIVFSLIFVGKK